MKSRFTLFLTDLGMSNVKSSSICSNSVIQFCTNSTDVGSDVSNIFFSMLLMSFSNLFLVLVKTCFLLSICNVFSTPISRAMKAFKTVLTTLISSDSLNLLEFKTDNKTDMKIAGSLKIIFIFPRLLEASASIIEYIKQRSLISCKVINKLLLSIASKV